MTLTVADLLAIWGPLLLFGVGALAWIRHDIRGLEDTAQGRNPRRRGTP